MVKHIVFWKLNEEVNAAEAVFNIKNRLEALVGQIEGLGSLEVHPCKKGGWDACLISEHDSFEALSFYREHPLHKEVQKFVHSVICDRTSADFEF